MSSRGWKLSAALISLLALPTQAQPTREAYGNAMYCTLIAATVYAEMTDESAEAIAAAAPQKCWDEWKAANALLRADAIAETEKMAGRKMTEAEIAAGSGFNAVDQNVTNEIKMRVMDWRAQAKLGNASVYELERDKFRARQGEITRQ